MKKGQHLIIIGSHEVSEADANRAEIARLRDQLEKAETARKAWTEIGARSEADAAAWIAFVGEAAWQLEHGARCEEIQSDLVEAYQRARDGNAPGAALLAELEAARALADSVTAYFNNRGVAQALRTGNADIAAMADALSDYGAIVNRTS